MRAGVCACVCLCVCVCVYMCICVVRLGLGMSACVCVFKFNKPSVLCVCVYHRFRESSSSYWLVEAADGCLNLWCVHICMCVFPYHLVLVYPGYNFLPGLCSFWWILAVFHQPGFHTSIVMLWKKQSRRTRICTKISKNEHTSALWEILHNTWGSMY